MALNDFLVFNEQMNDILTDEQYLSDPQRLGGLQTGLARSNMHNKLFRQSSIMNAAIGEIIKENGINASDKNLSELVTAFKKSIMYAPSISLSPSASAVLGKGNVDESLISLFNKSSTIDDELRDQIYELSRTVSLIKRVSKTTITVATSSSPPYTSEYALGDFPLMAFISAPSYSGAEPSSTVMLTQSNGYAKIKGGIDTWGEAKLDTSYIVFKSGFKSGYAGGYKGTHEIFMLTM